MVERRSGRIPTTQWSLVVQAGDRERGAGREALAALCARYWYPVYAYLRRQGRDADSAQDLTQGFFTRLLEREDLTEVDAERGRFRAYLLASVDHFVTSQHRRAAAKKRGGGAEVLPFSVEDAEARYAELDDDAGPEELCERLWALALIEAVLARLRDEYVQRDQALRFDVLRGCIHQAPDPGQYDAAARRLGLAPASIGVLVKRLRERFAALLRQEVADTVAEPADVATELRALMHALVPS